MHPLEAKVKKFIAVNTPLSDADRVVVGLSGGADSTALLLLLKNLGYDVVALHCNFHLRGEESLRDCRHSADVARTAGCPFEKIDFDVDAYRKSHPGTSTEMACRELRYQWFEERRTALGARCVAVAHHRSDNIETFFLNLLRGSSINGLTGMEPFDTRNNLLRPLLDVDRSEIEAYLAGKGIGFVTDSSNASLDYRRNQLRNAVLPVLRQFYPDADLRILQSIGLLRQNRSFYRDSVNRTIGPYLTPEGIDVRNLATEQHSSLILFEYLRDRGLTFTQASDIMASADKSGLQFGPFLLDHGILRPVDSRPEPSPDDIEIYIAPVSELQPQRTPKYAFFSSSLFSRRNEIKVRSWQPSDRLKPWGSEGSKKLSDLFNDMKIAVDRKKSIPVVTLGDEILWVAGIRASRLFPIPPDATEITVMRMR